MKQKTAMLFTIILLFYVCMWGGPPFDKELDGRLGELLRSKICENGSCGWVAYCVSGYLDRGGISNEIVTLNGFGYETIHVVVRVGEIYIDKHGFSSKYHPMLLLEKKVISRGKLYEMLNNFPIWNTNFKFKDTSIIKKIILHE